MPALAKAKAKAEGIICLKTPDSWAWLGPCMRTTITGALAIQLGGNVDLDPRGLAPKNDLNWVNNIMDWETHSDNTNPATILNASLGRTRISR